MAADVVTLDSQFLNLVFLRGRARVVAGSALLAELVGRGALRNKHVFVVGNYTSEELTPVLNAESVSSCIPSMGLQPQSDEAAQILSSIVTANPDIVLLCVGAPHSEELSVMIKTITNGSVSVLCCGAALDFVMGRRMRAPKLIQSLGIEWFWRLLREPRRLWSRYTSDLRFLVRSRPRIESSGKLYVGDVTYNFGPSLEKRNARD